MKLAGSNYFQRSQVYFNNVPVPTAVNSRVEIVATIDEALLRTPGRYRSSFAISVSPIQPIQNSVTAIRIVPGSSSSIDKPASRFSDIAQFEAAGGSGRLY